MVSNFNFINTENHDEWLTPPELIKSLGHFDLDPCAPIKRPWEMAEKHYTIADNGLLQKWCGRVWLNPPYGRETFKWMARLSEHGNGLALIFARTETKGFHEQVWNKADAVFFFRDRINFHKVDGTKSDRANAPSCLVAYGHDNIEAIRKSGLTGKLISLHPQPAPPQADTPIKGAGEKKPIPARFLIDVPKLPTPAPIDAEVREALREFIYETTHLSREEPDGSHKCVIPKSTLDKGRAALKKGG